MLSTLALLAALTLSPHELLVRQAATAMDVDPDYAACVVARESEWNPAAVGALGEEGLFQILPSTGKWIASQWGWKSYDGFDPITNALMGTWLLAQGYDDWFSTARFCQ